MIQVDSIVRFTNPFSRNTKKSGTVLKVVQDTALVRFTHRRETYEDYFLLRNLKVWQPRKKVEPTKIDLLYARQITPIITRIFEENPIMATSSQRIPSSQFPDAKQIRLRIRFSAKPHYWHLFAQKTAQLKRELHKCFGNLSDITGTIDDLRITINDGPWHAKYQNGVRLTNSIYFKTTK